MIVNCTFYKAGTDINTTPIELNTLTERLVKAFAVYEDDTRAILAIGHEINDGGEATYVPPKRVKNATFDKIVIKTV